MLELITFKPALGARSPSPFAVKAEALLAMSGLPFTKTYSDVRKSPRGKLPVLIDGERTVPDSAHIQSYLETEKGIDFDSGLSAEQRAVAVAIRRLVEEHFYFIAMNFRWLEHPETIKKAFFDEVPTWIRGLVFGMVNRNVKKTIHLQGLGRHSRDQLIAKAGEDLKAISDILGAKKFLLDDVPTSIDASVYGAIHNLLDFQLETPLTVECRKHDNLVAYCARFAETVFDD